MSGPIWPKFELVRDFMHVLVTNKYKKDRIQNTREKGGDINFPIISQWGLCHENLSFDPICPKTLCSLSLTPIMLHINMIKIGQLASEIFKFKSVKFSSLKGNYLQNEWFDSAQIRTRPSFYACSGYQQL